MIKLEELKLKIEPILKSLEVDGFSVEIVYSENNFEINITETNSSCSSCLMPKKVLEHIVNENVNKLNFDYNPNVSINFPTD